MTATTHPVGPAVASRTWRDIVLAFFTVQFAASGSWAALFPDSFYDSFPGGGRTWIAVDGPLNEHLIRDVGSLWLGLAVLAAFALARRSTDLARATGLAVAVYSVPHIAYHLANTDPYGSGDIIASIGSLAIGLALALLLVISPGPTEP